MKSISLFMSKDVVTVDQNLSFTETFRVMIDRKIGSVFITEKGKPKRFSSRKIFC